MTSNNAYNKACYILNSDIDLGGVSWEPVGLGRDNNDSYEYKHRMFSGTFIGNRKTISGLQVSGNYMYSGLFGVLRGAKVSDLVIKGDVITEHKDVAYAAGLAGMIQYGTVVDGVGFVGNLSSKSDKYSAAGAITADCYAHNTIMNCYSVCDVSSDDAAGGITGYITFSETNAEKSETIIENCWHKGKVNGKKTGAVAGECDTGNMNVKANIVNCYVTKDTIDSITNPGVSSDNTSFFSDDVKKESGLSGDYFRFDKSSELPLFSWESAEEETEDKSEEETDEKSEENESDNAVLTGDINGSGEVDVSDITLLSLYTVGDIDFNDYEKKAADMDGNGIVNLADLARLKQIICHSIS